MDTSPCRKSSPNTSPEEMAFLITQSARPQGLREKEFSRAMNKELPASSEQDRPMCDRPVLHPQQTPPLNPNFFIDMLGFLPPVPP